MRRNMFPFRSCNRLQWSLWSRNTDKWRASDRAALAFQRRALPWIQRVEKAGSMDGVRASFILCLSHSYKQERFCPSEGIISARRREISVAHWMNALAGNSWIVRPWSPCLLQVLVAAAPLLILGLLINVLSEFAFWGGAHASPGDEESSPRIRGCQCTQPLSFY